MLLIKQCVNSWLLGFNSWSFSITISLFVTWRPDVFHCHVLSLQAQNVDLDHEIATARKHQLFGKFVACIRVEEGLDDEDWIFGDSSIGDPHEDLIRWVTFLHQCNKIEVGKKSVSSTGHAGGTDASVKARVADTVVKSTAATAAKAESLAGQADIRNSFAMGSKQPLHDGIFPDGQNTLCRSSDDDLEAMLESLMDEEEAAEAEAAAAVATVRSTPTPAKAKATSLLSDPSPVPRKGRGRGRGTQQPKAKANGGMRGPVIRKCLLDDHVEDPMSIM